MELCLIKCYLLQENNLRLLQSSGPIELSEYYFQKIQYKTIMEALN